MTTKQYFNSFLKQSRVEEFFLKKYLKQKFQNFYAYDIQIILRTYKLAPKSCNNKYKYFFFRIKANEKGAAKVGVTESTLVPTKYLHPEHKKIIYWDLPGIGTPTYPNLDEYCKKIGGLEKYDAFLIFCKTRFTNYDRELAKKVSTELNKPFFFIRTNVDTDLENAKEDEGPKSNDTCVVDIMKIMKDDCWDNLESLIDDEQDIYMIDNKATSEYDFQRLRESISIALPDKKMQKFSDSLQIKSHAVIKIKTNLLRGIYFMKSF